MRKKGVLLLVIAILIFILTEINLFSKQLIVTLKANVFPYSSILYLKDIASVYSQYPSVKRKAERILISRGVLPKEITKKEVELKLYGSGFTDFSVVGAQKVRIIQGKEISQLKRIKKLVENYIRKKYSFAKRIEIKFTKLPELYIEEGSRIKIEPFPVSGFTQTQLFKVHSIKNSKIISTGFLQVKVRVWAMMPVSKRYILKGERIKNSDFQHELRELTSSNWRFVRSEKLLVSKIARYSIREGEVLREELLSSPYLVRRGERVYVYVKFKGIKVVLSGISLDDGRLGERVRVKNEKSGKILYGIVSSKRRVEVSV